MKFKEMHKKLIIYLLLASVAVVWGFGFVFTKQVYSYITPAMLNIVRFAIASLIMFLLYFKKVIKLTKKQWLYGFATGLIMSLGFGLQAYGMQITSSSNGALLTGLNVVMVPFFAWIFNKKRPPTRSFFAAFIAFGGIAFLSFGGLSKINIGDLLCFLCAIAFAFHFIVLDKTSKLVDPGALTFVQMLTAAVVFAIVGLAFDFNSLTTCTFDKALIFPMLSLSVLSTGYAYVVQTTAQKVVPPSKVSLILSCESMLGALFSVLLGLDKFTWYLAVSAIGVTLALFISEANFAKHNLPVPVPETDCADAPEKTEDAAADEQAADAPDEEIKQ